VAQYYTQAASGVREEAAWKQTMRAWLPSAALDGMCYSSAVIAFEQGQEQAGNRQCVPNV
jgi:hypothetical protein